MLPLENKHILVTSGPTRSYIDSVRYIANMSTGELGRKIVIEALKNGANVTMVYGTGSKVPCQQDLNKLDTTKLTKFEIETNVDLSTLFEHQLKNVNFNAIIHAMAVLDYVPKNRIDGKIASVNTNLEIPLVKTPKIIKLIRRLWPLSFLIGFKLEVGISREELIKRAVSFLSTNMVDLVVANDLKTIKDGQHKACVVNKDKYIEADYTSKDEIAIGLAKLMGSQI